MIGITKRLKQENRIEFERFANFGRISASLIHDMSTPLSAATLTLGQIQIEQSIDPLFKRLSHDLKILETYLLAAKSQLSGESNNVNFSLTLAIRQVVKLLTTQANAHRVKIVVNISSNVRIYGNRVKFHQIMANLILNAVEACDLINNRPKKVTIKLIQLDSRTIKIVVSDNGIGIKPSAIPKIFNPFYSTKQRLGRNGLGFGLAIVKECVEQDFKGSIDVNSKQNQGTEFIIMLPLINEIS
jgi:signal transduction histidine kinase